MRVSSSDSGQVAPAGKPAQVRIDLIRAAAGRVLEADDPELGGASESRELMGQLVARIEDGLPSGADDTLPSGRTRPGTLARRLVELLRAQIVRSWSEAPERATAAEMLEVLERMEVVREALEPDWSGFFSSQLSGPGGQELVVEVAHDLRSPLTSILFLAETLQLGQSGPVTDLQHRQLGLIYSAALGLSAVTSDVIDLAHGGNGLVDGEPVPFSVSEIFESVRDMVRPIAEEKGLTVRISSPGTNDHRLGYPLALSRVLLNLTTNALKFTDAGFVEILAAANGPRAVDFSVRDTGRGIATTALRGLYLPFRHGTGRSAYGFSGTGLGLAICRRLVEAMGSSLEVDTRPNWGTRFFFELPLPPTADL